MWRQDESGRVHTPFEPAVLAATLALIPVLIIEADAKSDGWQRFAEAANWTIWAVFAIELVAVLVAASRKGAALDALASAEGLAGHRWLLSAGDVARIR
jgi:hypothetical protein